MIKYNYEISVNDNKARLNKDIFLFRGNRNIHYYFSIKGARFTFSKTNEDLIESSNAIYAAVTVIKPNGLEVANAIAPVEDGVIHLKVTEDLIDEEVEVGDFDLVFDLFDDSEGAVTIPKIKGQFHVQERPCETSIGTLSGNVNVVNQAVVDLAIATQENEQLVVVDDDGKYVKTVWKTGDKISVERLNKIEEGLEDVSAQFKENQINLIEDDTSMEGISDSEHDSLKTDNKTIIGGINEVNAKLKDIANKTIIEGNKIYLAKADGTKLDEGTDLPIQEVDLSSYVKKENGKSLITDTERNKLTNLENYDDTSIKNDIQVQKSRIDSFTSLKEGSTTGDAELVDARVGEDGITYDNLGDSIRSQLLNLSEGKQSMFIAQTSKCDNVYINTVNGMETSSNSWMSTDYVDISNVSKIGYIELFETSAGLSFYDESKKFISSISGSGYTFKFKTSKCPDNAKYVRVCANKTYADDVNIWILEKNYAIKNEVENISKKLDNAIIDSFIHSSNLINRLDLVSITKDCGVTCIKNNDKSFTFTGKPTKDCYIEFSLNCEHLSIGKYFLGYNGVIEGIKPSDHYYLWLYNNEGNGSDRLLYINNLSKDTSFTITEEKECTKLRLVFFKDSIININTSHFWLNFEVLDKQYKPPYVANTDETKTTNTKYSKLKMNCLGDSITFGMIPDSGMTDQMARPYPTVLKELLGLAECRNYGQSGTCLSVVKEDETAISNRNNAFVTRMKTMDKDADIIAIFGGVNDYIRSVGGYCNALGTLESEDDTSIYGALKQITKYMIETYPKAVIFFITPMKQAGTTGVSPYEPKFTLDDVVNAIKEVASINSIPVLDLYTCSGVHFENDIWRAIYGGNDKLHPNQLFVEEHLSVLIANFIKTLC